VWGEGRKQTYKFGSDHPGSLAFVEQLFSLVALQTYNNDNF